MVNFLDTLKEVNRSWTLFLDRDGVINKEINKNYIKSVNEFFFLPNVIESIVNFTKIFGSIVIVTNQRGVELKLMTEMDLQHIHQHMTKQIEKQGGEIDLILACTSLHNDSFMRKPQSGMAYQAKQKIPTIRFEKSIIIGNSHSDLLFGRNVNMHTVFLTTNKTLETHQRIDADLITDSLASFNKLISSP